MHSVCARFAGFTYLVQIRSPPCPLHESTRSRLPLPGSSDSWMGMDRRPGGRSTAVAGIPGQPETYLMGAVGGGVWETTNAGQNGSNISDGHFDVGAIGSVAVSETAPNVVYAGTGSACIRGNISTGRGIYKSTDGGDNWDKLGGGLPEKTSGSLRRPQRAADRAAQPAPNGAEYGRSAIQPDGAHGQRYPSGDDSGPFRREPVTCPLHSSSDPPKERSAKAALFAFATLPQSDAGDGSRSRPQRRISCARSSADVARSTVFLRT